MTVVQLNSKTHPYTLHTNSKGFQLQKNTQWLCQRVHILCLCNTEHLEGRREGSAIRERDLTFQNPLMGRVKTTAHSRSAHQKFTTTGARSLKRLFNSTQFGLFSANVDSEVYHLVNISFLPFWVAAIITNRTAFLQSGEVTVPQTVASSCSFRAHWCSSTTGGPRCRWLR